MDRFEVKDGGLNAFEWGSNNNSGVANKKDNKVEDSGSEDSRGNSGEFVIF